ASGGFVDLKAGVATDSATLTAAKTIDVSAGTGSDAGDVRLAACQLTVQPNVLVDARGSGLNAEPAINLIGESAITLGAGARFFVQSNSSTRLVEAPNTTVAIAPDVVFSPGVVTTVATPERSPFPPCPVCGDGVRQLGEPCDPGLGADGACCRSDCLALVCPTPTTSPTPTLTAT